MGTLIMTFKDRFDKLWIGILVGIVGAALGFLGFGFAWSAMNDTDFNYFYHDVFLNTGFYQDKIITVSILLDVLLFYLFMRINWLNICKGLLGVVIVSVPVVIYFY
jgi:hypothetical protein